MNNALPHIGAGQLADFDARGGHGVEAAGGEAFVSLEQAVDGGALIVQHGGVVEQQHDHAGEGDFFFVEFADEFGIGGQQVPLFLGQHFAEVGRRVAERFGRIGLGGQFENRVADLFVFDHGLLGSGMDSTMDEKPHESSDLRVLNHHLPARCRAQGDIMHTMNPYATADGHEGGGGGGGVPFVNICGGHFSKRFEDLFELVFPLGIGWGGGQKAFAGEAEDDFDAEVAQVCGGQCEAPVVGHGFAEADAGINGDAAAWDAGLYCGVDALGEVAFDGGEDLRIVGGGIVREAWADMHQHDCALAGRDRREKLGIVRAGGDVVDVFRPGGEAFHCHVCRARVNRYGHGAREFLQDGLDALPLLGCIYGLYAGAKEA